MKIKTIWTIITNICTAFLLLLAVGEGVERLGEFSSGTAVIARVDFAETRISPEMERTWSGMTSKQRMLEFIREGEKTGASADKVLGEIRSGLEKPIASQYSAIELHEFEGKDCLRIELTNSGDEPAENIRILAPGAGDAWISMESYYDREQEPLKWREEIPVGMLAPNGKKFVIVWFDKKTFLPRDASSMPISVVHSGGTGRIWKTKKVSGPWIERYLWLFFSPTAHLLELLGVALLAVSGWIWRRRLALAWKGAVEGWSGPSAA